MDNISQTHSNKQNVANKEHEQTLPPEDNPINRSDMEESLLADYDKSSARDNSSVSDESFQNWSSHMPQGGRTKNYINDTDESSSSSESDDSESQGRSLSDLNTIKPRSSETTQKTAEMQDPQCKKQQMHDKAKTPGSQDNKERRIEKTGSTLSALYVIGIVAVLAIYLVPELNKTKEIPHENVVEAFTREFSNLPSTYLHQNEKVWRVMRATMKRHLKDQFPKEPAVIMIVSTQEAASERENIAKQIAETYSIRCQRNHPVVVYGKNYERMDNNVAKEAIDKKITDAFSENSCAAVISNFHMLPPAATTVFYQFCENDNAPFKNVSIIFTLEIVHGIWDRYLEFPDLKVGKVPDPKSWDEIVENFLYHNLENRDGSDTMKRDMISGLLSRIIPSVVWVAPESGDKEL